nr:putative reverse transcriptase domain-containing protein [Tanacetum cinerariifolium]
FKKMAPKRTTRSTQVPPITPAPTVTTITVTEAQLQALIDQGVAAAMAEAEASRVRNGYGSNGSGPRLAQAVHECTYLDFLKCQPLNFKGTEGVIGLTQWFEKIESVFNISNCTAACQVKYATCTLQGKGNGCYECEAQGHFKRNCPKLKNNNRGNQGSNDNAQARVYVIGNAGENPDNVVAGTFLLNKRYAYILFDTGADRSFVSTTFSSQIEIAPIALDHHYNVEIADGRIIGLNTIMRDCTLNFLYHLFNIDLLPVELGSFDVTVGMNWLSKYDAVITCAEKLVRIPFGNEILTIRGEGNNERNESQLNIISCSKAQDYMSKGCHVFLANITSTKDEDKSKRKQLEDFRIDLVPGAAPVARAPYRLAPSEMKELADQLQELTDKGFIRPSSSPWGALVLFVKKKDGSFQMCIDYQELNKLTDKKGHEVYLKAILELLKKEELYAKFSKCEFWIPKVQFLGHVIDSVLLVFS